MSREEIPVTKVEYFSDHVEFGDFVLGEAKIEVIRFKNIGDQPYIITGYGHSCECIEADYETTVIMPGEEGEVRITLTSAGYEPVPFEANISIRDNSTPDRRNIIKTNGIIKKKQISRERL